MASFKPLTYQVMKIVLSKWDIMDLATAIVDNRDVGEAAIPVYDDEENYLNLVCRFTLEIFREPKDMVTGWAHVDTYTFSYKEIVLEWNEDIIQDLEVDVDEALLDKFISGEIHRL